MNATDLSIRTNLLALMLTTVLPVAVAQEIDHSKMSMPMPTEEKPAPNKEPAHREPALKEATNPTTHSHASPARHPPAKDMPLPTDHPGQHHSDMDHAGHYMDAMPATEDASMQSMDHAAMTMAPTDPRTPVPPVTEADRAAAAPPTHAHSVGDNAIHSYTLLNRLEGWNADSGAGFGWEGQGWVGTDLNRLWWRSEGERNDGSTESASLEMLYGRSVSTWWDVVAGVRHDFKPGDDQSFAVIGVQGLAPQKFEVQATAYFGERGQTAARFEAEYELLVTNRLILQPLLEVDLYGKSDPTRGIGSGLSTAEAGLRLRYEFTRRFAPYIGVVYERAFGNTADLRREAFERTDDTQVVVGLRIWF